VKRIRAANAHVQADPDNIARWNEHDAVAVGIHELAPLARPRDAQLAITGYRRRPRADRARDSA